MKFFGHRGEEFSARCPCGEIYSFRYCDVKEDTFYFTLNSPLECKCGKSYTNIEKRKNFCIKCHKIAPVNELYCDECKTKTITSKKIHPIIGTLALVIIIGFLINSCTNIFNNDNSYSFEKDGYDLNQDGKISNKEFERAVKDAQDYVKWKNDNKPIN